MRKEKEKQSLEERNGNMAENLGGRPKRKDFYKIQKSVITRNYKDRNKGEEINIKRLKVGHTGFNDTMYVLGKRNNDRRERCGVKEKVEHTILHCNRYAAERERLQEKVRAAGHERSLVGLLGTEGEAEGIRSARKALFTFSHDTRLMDRIYK